MRALVVPFSPPFNSRWRSLAERFVDELPVCIPPLDGRPYRVFCVQYRIFYTHSAAAVALWQCERVGIACDDWDERGRLSATLTHFVRMYIGMRRLPCVRVSLRARVFGLVHLEVLWM